MNNVAIGLTILCSSLLLGCASTGVIPIDKDSYMIGKKDGTPGIGVSLSNKAEVYKEANEFCSAKSLEVETLRVVTEPAKPAQLGYTELHFKCVQKGSTAKPLVREPDTIIEFRNK
jgi:hypothetical protein